MRENNDDDDGDDDDDHIGIDTLAARPRRIAVDVRGRRRRHITAARPSGGFLRGSEKCRRASQSETSPIR